MHMLLQYIYTVFTLALETVGVNMCLSEPDYAGPTGPAQFGSVLQYAV